MVWLTCLAWERLRSVHLWQRTLRSILSWPGFEELYRIRVIGQMGLTEAMKQKLVLVPPGKPIPEVVNSGEAPAGVQQLPEVIGQSSTEIAGTLPKELGTTTIFAAGSALGSAEPDANWCIKMADTAVRPDRTLTPYPLILRKQ